MGVQDQWGNIIVGVEFICKMIGDVVYGLVILLIIKVDGIKYGKMEFGMVWVDFELMSVYVFY